MAKIVRVKLLQEFKELFNPDWRNLVYYGGRGSGKSMHVAEVLLIRGSQSKLRILCTREIQKTIKDSVHKLLADLISEHGYTDYEVTDKAIRNKRTGTEFIFSGLKHNVNEIKSMEGVDIAWCEEAQSLSEQSLKVLAPTIRKEGSQLIFTFNRVNELDPVYVRYVMNKPSKTFVAKVNYDVLDKAGLFPESLRLELEEDKKYPEVFNHVWLGEPISQSEMSILNRDTVLKAMERSGEDDGAIEVGADIARLGNDRIVFWKRKGLKTIDHKVLSKLRTTETCDALEQFVDFDKTILIKVDDTGVGGGVTDEMMKRGYNIMAINFGEAAVDKDKYPNWISEAWFYMQTIMEQADLPVSNELLMELSTRQWFQDTKGKRRVESKGEYKKRGFRSPDLADACIICYYTPIIPKMEWAMPE